MTELKRLQSEEGSFTSVCFTDEANANVIRTVLDAWLRGDQLDCAKRGTNHWTKCREMPLDFSDYMYRISRLNTIPSVKWL